MQTIYLDILFCVNFIIDYIILITVKTFMSISCRRLRLILGAAVGGICSFVILLPPVPSGISLFVNLITAFLVIAAAFFPVSPKMYMKLTAAFFLISFGYCGLMIAVWLLFSPQNLIIRNSSVYISVSPLMLIITTVFCYTVLRVIIRIVSRGSSRICDCKVSFELNGMNIECSGKIDSGSTLKEPFSGEMAVVFKKELLGDMQDSIFSSNSVINKIRVIPYTSVGGEGLMKAVRIEKMKITTDKESFYVSAYAAFCDSERVKGTDALIPAELIP